MITETKWGRFDGYSLLTFGGDYIPCNFVFTQDAYVDNEELVKFREYLLKNSVALGGITKVTFYPNRSDVQMTVEYESGTVRHSSVQELFFKALFECYAENKAAIDKGTRIATETFGVNEGEIALEPYVARLLKI